MRKLNNIGIYTHPKHVLFDETTPITHNDIDSVYIFYTPDGRLIQSATYDEAYAKWLLTKETD